MPTYRPWYDDPPRRSDVVTIPLFWLALVLSLLVHVAALWYFATRPLPIIAPGMEPNDVSVPMSVKLATAPASRPPPQPSPPPSPPPPPPTAPKAPPKPSLPRPRVPPILSALPGVPSTERLPMLPEPVAPQTLPSPATATPPEEMAGDLSSYIASQRHARGEATPTPSANPADDREARRDRAIAANLASSNSPTYYGEPKNTGGVFRITFVGYDDAEFTFFGWNRDIKRRASQKIEVRRGDNPNIRIAIVRKMISIIREYEHEDFTWKSEQSGRVVTLSAREKDNADLESYLLRDFVDLASPKPPPR